jgi:hypothetical protein
MKTVNRRLTLISLPIKLRQGKDTVGSESTRIVHVKLTEQIPSSSEIPVNLLYKN